MILTDNLISYWELNETSGTRIDAVTATGNDLTDNNTVTSNTGIVGTAAEFTGTNLESLTRTDNASLSTGDIDFSMAMWIYPTVGASVGVFYKGNSTGVEYGLTARSNGQFRLEVDNGPGLVNITPVNSTPTYTINNWYFVVAWHDSVNNQIAIQVNNATPDTTAYSLGSWDSTIALSIGVDGDFGDYFTGRLDQIGFWKRILTADERTALYNSGSGLSYLALRARAKFNKSYRPRPFAPGIAR